MRTLFCFSLLLFLLSCKPTNVETIAPEYPDWYTIQSPIDKELQSVWGNRDKTLVIATFSEVFRSTDQGKSWKKVLQQSIGIFGLVSYKDTLFTLNGLLNSRYLVNPGNYSIDDGKNWQRYTRRNPVFDPSENGSKTAYSINPVTTANSLQYTINQVFLDGPAATTGIFETPGVIRSDGRRIDLPQLHQLHSLYLDDQERLYITGTDAVCSSGHSGQSFSFCNSKNGRGVVYISKRPQP
ncbi:beta propeller repeat protein [Spirosoma pollinicola]|uniref:Exo-alpha-sialidase n=1 Tax=Spirosoma pollinicola TaxID=2057025 RepID=A0A2K8YZI9_9BACT|nr:hypothetical protein [Spirosoma pollinicola]AUD02968.1 hypothetical protein CWM47_14670 [Spirosoma pollinicola]